MPSIALANGRSDVACEDGSRGGQCDEDRYNWDRPSTVVTGDATNDKFFVQGIPAAVQGDRVAEHADGGPCVETPMMHQPMSSLHAANFYVGGKRVMRIGSKFNTGTPFDHTIVTGVDAFSIGGPDDA